MPSSTGKIAAYGRSPGNVATVVIRAPSQRRSHRVVMKANPFSVAAVRRTCPKAR
jgi:hypothetical protein